MAAVLLTYLLKANVVLALFAAAYYGLLRGLTFFGLNRAYLLLALLFAAVYPALPVPALLPARALPLLPTVVTHVASPAPPEVAASAGLDWPRLALGLYAAGTAGLLLRLLGQLGSLALVRRRSRPTVVLGQAVRVLPGAGGPFSFGRTVYLSEVALADADSLPAALRHEHAHVRQYHTLDVLLTQLATALAWANPAAWLLRRAVLDNLEYLADRAALHTGLDRRAYQYSLLRQQPGGVPAPALAFHFSFPTLKNRIIMLNQPTSTTRQLGRYLLAAPLLMALALAYTGARAQTPQTAPAAWHVPAGAQVYINGVPATGPAAEALDPQTIGSMKVLAGIEARIFSPGSGSIIALTTKADEQAAPVQHLNDRLAQATALVPSIDPQDLPKPAQEYITRTFPDCRLAQTNKILPAAKERAVYQALLAKGRRPQGYLLFDATGNFLEKL
ncbi:M56 family metallopeptidase [Hymenobacter sp. BRD128]|uniref:M56 family metallopeptidase n=1 Tax=Hymenobacter sp. BRD128 TaxID=2675878 RepID=UPI001562EBD5|nr:M56 family metallopeptidase [Hymenobacter sp. BRD128]QKG58178.1 M56 family metallopeptidase [Hymenobacter sp. BRD128]